ncbi:MAG: hypothetical protein WBS22_05685 [Methylocystis sp.]
MKKLVWRVRLVADFGDEAAATEVEVARIERDEFTVPETLGLSLGEGKRLTAAIQTEMVRAQAGRRVSASGAASIADRTCPPKGTDP